MQRPLPRAPTSQAQPSWCDHQKGVQSRAALTRFMGKGTVRIQRQDKDHYGSMLALLTVNCSDAGEWMIRDGLARHWK